MSESGDELSEFFDFFRFIYPRGDPRRQGCPLFEIDAFEQQLGFALSGLHRSYLANFGRRDVVLKLADDGDATLASISRFHREQRDEVPAGGVMLGVNGLSGDRALVNGEVAVTKNGGIVYVSARSFKNHLYRQAFVRGRFNQARLVMRKLEETDLTHITTALEAIGFRAYSFSDDCQVSLERPGAAYAYVERIPGRARLFASFAESDERDAARRALVAATTGWLAQR